MKGCHVSAQIRSIAKFRKSEIDETIALGRLSCRAANIRTPFFASPDTKRGIIKGAADQRRNMAHRPSSLVSQPRRP
jgi:hypothetical protein